MRAHISDTYDARTQLVLRKTSTGRTPGEVKAGRLSRTRAAGVWLDSAQTVGLMFLLKRNTLCGSHLFLSDTSRSNFSAPYAPFRKSWLGDSPAL